MARTTRQPSLDAPRGRPGMLQRSAQPSNDRFGRFSEAFARAIGPGTRVLYFSHVTTSTGLVLPARELCALARQRGMISIVDGAHAPGMVPLDLRDVAADFYAANCHKWLMAPATAGFLHVAAAHKPTLEALVTSWGYDYDRAQPNFKPQYPGGGGYAGYAFNIGYARAMMQAALVSQ